MEITPELARALFEEALGFENGVGYLAESSILRALATATYGHATLSTIHKVCSDVFRIVAIDALRREREAVTLLQGLENWTDGDGLRDTPPPIWDGIVAAMQRLS